MWLGKLVRGKGNPPLHQLHYLHCITNPSHSYHAAIHPSVHSEPPPPPQGRPTWPYFKSNIASTNAAAVRRRAHWILFINKVIHKWWDLSSACVRVGEVVVIEGRRWKMASLSLYPLTLGWVADGCWEGFAPEEVGGQWDWAPWLLEQQNQSAGLFEVGWSKLALHRVLSGGSGLGENTQSYSSLGGFPVWLRLSLLRLLNRNTCLVRCHSSLLCVSSLVKVNVLKKLVISLGATERVNHIHWSLFLTDHVTPDNPCVIHRI